MYEQFEKQYSDFLRSHLTHLDIKEHRETERDLLAHLRDHITSCEPGAVFEPLLTKSLKSEDLAGAHLALGGELLESGQYLHALAEVNEGLRNTTTTATLLHLLLLRITIQDAVAGACSSDLRIVSELCCDKCYKMISNSNQDGNHGDQNSGFFTGFAPRASCVIDNRSRHFLKKISQKLKRLPGGPPTKDVPLPELPDAQSETEYPCVSSCVQVRVSEDKGRHVLASRDVHVGEVLAVEEAKVWTVLQGHSTSHCQLCLKKSRSPIPCSGCPDAVFCSLACHDTDTYHKLECGYVSSLQSLPKMVYLAFRTVLIFKDDILSRSKMKETSKEFGQLVNLITNLSSRSPIDLLKRTCTSLFLSNIVKQLNVFRTMNPNNHQIFTSISHAGADGPGKEDITSSTDGDITSVVEEVLLKCLQSYPCNAHEVSELQMKQQFRYSMNEDIGSGAFPFLSLLNHACNPNVVRNSIGKSTVLRALRRIPRGSELLDNYGYHYATHLPPERRKALRSQYLFVCLCECCADKTQKWRTFPDVPQKIVFRCSACDKDYSETLKCCETDYSRTVHQIRHLAGKVRCHIDRFVCSGDPRGCTQPIIQFLKLCEAHTRPPFKTYNECQEVLKQIWNLQSNCS